MGADFMLAWCPDLSHIDQARIVDALHSPAMHDALVEAVGWFDCYFETAAEEAGLVDTAGEVDPDQIVASGFAARTVAAAAAKVWGADYDRELAHIDGCIYTGGMSWGDSPTELYNDVALLSDIGGRLVDVLGIDHPSATRRCVDLVRTLLDSSDPGLTGSAAAALGEEATT